MSAAPKTSAATPLQSTLSWFPVHEFFSLDLRSLALLRIGLGIMLLLEWLNRLVDVRMFFSDEGVMPRQLVMTQGTYPPLSIFFLSGSAWFAGALMIVGCVLALLLLVGWRTQFMTLLSWFLLIGVQGRNFIIMQGGDVVMRMLLFWAIFLPLGACYSLDALREPPREWRPRFLSVGSVAYIVQMCLIYWFAAAWKSDPAWRTDHTAVYLALSLDCFTTPLGHWLLNFPEFLKVLTVATMILEIFAPAVLFVPFAHGPLRTFVCASFILFHAGLGLCIELGNFPPICIVAWLAVLPAWFWDQLGARLRSAKRSGLVIYYDGDNPRQRKLAEAARMFLLLHETKIVPAQEDGRRLARIRAADSWLVIDADGREWVGYDAFLQLVRVSLFRPLLPVFRYAPAVYHSVARVFLALGRPVRRFGQTVGRWLLLEHIGALVSWLPHSLAEMRQSAAGATGTSEYPGARLGGWVQNSIVLFLLIYLIAWNLRTLDTSTHATHNRDYFPEEMSGLGYVLALDQSWGLFAPKPGGMDGWYVVPAVLNNGRVVDLYTDGGELTDAKPPLVSAKYSNTRTRKYLMNLAAPNWARFRPFYANYLYENWNRSHGEDEKIRFMYLIYMLKWTKPDQQVNDFHEDRLQLWPPEGQMLDPITKKPFVLSLAVGVGMAAPPPLIAARYNRPVIEELKAGSHDPAVLEAWRRYRPGAHEDQGGDD